MTKRWYLIVCIILLSLSITPFQIKEAKGIGVSGVEYWFFMNKPTTLDYSDMYLTVYNTEDYSVQVNCSYEKIFGLDLEVKFEWNSTIIEPNEEKTNKYSIKVKSNFTLEHNLRLYVTYVAESEIGSGNPVGTGGIFINRLFYYSNETGALLDLNVVDQSNKPRFSELTLRYQKNESMSFTTIFETNDTRINGYFPLGKYVVEAIDDETHISTIHTFTLDEDLTEFVVLELIGIKNIQLIQPIEETLGVMCTVNNYLDRIEDVEFYAELYIVGENDTHIDANATNIGISNKIQQTYLDRITSYRLTLWFGGFNLDKLEIGTHHFGVFIKMFSATELIAYKSSIFSITKHPEEEVKRGWEEDILNTDVLFMLIIVMLVAYIGYGKYKKGKVKDEKISR